MKLPRSEATRLTRPARRMATRAALRLFEHAQDEVARGLAQRVGTVSDARVNELLASPARRAMLDGLFWGLPRVLNDSDAHELADSVRFVMPGRPGEADEVYHLEYREGRWQRGREPERPARIVVTASAPDLVALATGRVAPVRLYTRGRLRLRGNPRTAMRFLAVIRERLGPSLS